MLPPSRMTRQDSGKMALDFVLSGCTACVCSSTVVVMAFEAARENPRTWSLISVIQFRDCCNGGLTHNLCKTLFWFDYKARVIPSVCCSWPARMKFKKYSKDTHRAQTQTVCVFARGIFFLPPNPSILRELVFEELFFYTDSALVSILTWGRHSKLIFKLEEHGSTPAVNRLFVWHVWHVTVYKSFLHQLS